MNTFLHQYQVSYFDFGRFSPASHMHVDGCNLVRTFIMTRHTKHPFAPSLLLQQEDSHFDLRRQFCLIYAYFENHLVQELKHHSLHIH